MIVCVCLSIVCVCVARRVGYGRARRSRWQRAGGTDGRGSESALLLGSVSDGRRGPAAGDHLAAAPQAAFPRGGGAGWVGRTEAGWSLLHRALFTYINSCVRIVSPAGPVAAGPASRLENHEPELSRARGEEES